MTPRSLADGPGSIRFTINFGSDNSWFLPSTSGNVQLILRGGDGDLRISRNPNDYVRCEIG